MISFLLDMGVAPICGKWLLENGYNSVHLNDLNLNELPDNEIIKLAQLENKIILTCDTDFGTLMAFGKFSYPSVILFRLNDYTPDNICKKLSIILREITEVEFEKGIYITVKEESYRTRTLPFI